MALTHDDLALLRTVLQTQPVAALATLHRGEPAVSMVPCAWLPDGRAVLHVSRLATHTADLQAHARAALLVTAPAALADTPLALPRLSLQAEVVGWWPPQGHGAANTVQEHSQATAAEPDAELAARWRQAYLARFPEAEPMFDFGDFALVCLAPTALRFVAGFGRAHAVPLAQWPECVATLSGPPPIPPDTLAHLNARLAGFAQARDWGRFHSPKNLASALVVEAGELLEPFQWLTEAESRALSAERTDEVALEMADVLLYLLQLGQQLGVDVVAAAHRKIDLNERRFPPLARD